MSSLVMLIEIRIPQRIICEFSIFSITVNLIVGNGSYLYCVSGDRIHATDMAWVTQGTQLRCGCALDLEAVG